MILKHGDTERLRKPRNFKCDACGCIFVAEKQEYTTRQVDYDGSATYEAVCPECQSKAISNDDIKANTDNITNKTDNRPKWIETETTSGESIFKCPYCGCFSVDRPSMCPNPNCREHLTPALLRIF